VPCTLQEAKAIQLQLKNYRRRLQETGTMQDLQMVHRTRPDHSRGRQRGDPTPPPQARPIAQPLPME